MMSAETASQHSLASRLDTKSDEKLDDVSVCEPDSARSRTSPTSMTTTDAALNRDLEKNDPSSSDRSSPITTTRKPAAMSTTPPEKDPQHLVKFDVGDKENPKNWHPAFKAWITLQLGFLALVGSLGSSIISPASNAISAYFSVSTEVTVLTVSLYVLGFALGPMMWGPISEVYGRKWSMLPPLVALALFSIGGGFSTNLQTLLVTRFFGGLFGSAPISNVSAALGDLYDARERGSAMSFYSICVVGGPTLGPLIGSVITHSRLGWRWTEFIEAMFAIAMVTLAFFCMPEVYAPVLLRKKAQRLRREENDDRHWHPHDDVRITPKNVVTKYFSRPLIMLTTEPTVTCIAIYASFVYGMLYLFLEVFPIVFREERGWSPVVSTLPFLGLFVGTIAASAVNLGNQPYYMRAVEKNNGKPVPEARLPPMFIGGILFAVGLFWFGWTAQPSILWVSPVFAAGFIGAGFNVVFQQCLNYLVDEYGLYAASATSANTFLRSFFACGLPLAAGPLFRNLGVGPAASLLGGISCLALPVPFFFKKYGERLRRNSKFAPLSGNH